MDKNAFLEKLNGKELAPDVNVVILHKNDSVDDIAESERSIIYTILTTTRCEKDTNGWLDTGHERLVGFYCILDDAIEAVLSNRCDMWETIYNYVIIEKVYEGMYGSATYGSETWWFKWNKELGKYEPMEQPEFTKVFCGFTMG